ncbi:ribokinase [Candidatus Bipolaricaulota bacterium]|nr:ribokinase [Candidatus Bipolaricaulota bacterium]
MRIAVLGSLNMDLVMEVERLPRPGETVAGTSFSRYPGGKGNNQAIAAARLGAEVALFGRVGQDRYGEELLSVARDAGVDTSGVEALPGEITGVALILVGRDGQNQIAYAPGANGRIDEAFVKAILPRVRNADVLLLQLEIPISPLAFLLRRLPEDHPLVVLDPAPVQDLTPLPLHRVDYLTPNREELGALCGASVKEKDDLVRFSQLILGTGAKHLVVKADQDGAYLAEPGGVTHFPAYKVKAVDTTAAGDAFNAALAVSLAEGKGTYEAIGYANAAAAITVTRKGAASSLPTRAEVQDFLRHPYRHPVG